MNDWDDLAGSLLPERVDHRRDGTFVAHELRRQREEGGVVPVAPVLLTGRDRSAEVVERDLTVVVHEHAEPVEVAV